MILSGLCRLGRDCDVRYVASGSAAVGLSLAYSYGKKGDDGKRPTTWIDATLWGALGEALAPYLLKGSQVWVTLDEVHLHTYERNSGGTGTSLRGTVRMIELAGNKPRDEEKPAERKPEGVKETGSSSFGDFEGDFPF